MVGRGPVFTVSIPAEPQSSEAFPARAHADLDRNIGILIPTDTKMRRNAMPAEKATFTLPDELVRKLEKVPAGKRSLLVAEALRREFDRRAAVDALKKLRHRSVWRNKDHPDLLSDEEIVRYRPAGSRVTG
jgi:hypothetical protein